MSTETIQFENKQLLTDEWCNPKYLVELDNFMKFPRRSQELLFCCMMKMDKYKASRFMDVIGIPHYEEVKSPIEHLYQLADDILYFHKKHWIFDSACPQHEIRCGNKKYIVDFFYSNEEAKSITEYQGDIYPYQDIQVIVECDGHDFHQKTKEQVIRDNERQMALQLAGYDVIRFSGSQIYTNPLKCVKNVYDFIETKLGLS
ncbi:MAG: endonuclease domain-containing protein [Defluviitaleaceae bacterium]|nr:endonuclease domain-containing protein [Defluviitaleaceae bacterium]